MESQRQSHSRVFFVRRCAYICQLLRRSIILPKPHVLGPWHQKEMALQTHDFKLLKCPYANCSLIDKAEIRDVSALKAFRDKQHVSKAVTLAGSQLDNL